MEALLVLMGAAVESQWLCAGCRARGYCLQGCTCYSKHLLGILAPGQDAFAAWHMLLQHDRAWELSARHNAILAGWPSLGCMACCWCLGADRLPSQWHAMQQIYRATAIKPVHCSQHQASGWHNKSYNNCYQAQPSTSC
jgi:hypothetical protein